MTWYYNAVDGGAKHEIYEDDPEFTGVITTIENDGRGISQQDVMQVMRETWEDHANLGNSPVMDVRAGYIMMDMITENIQRGTP